MERVTQSSEPRVTLVTEGKGFESVTPVTRLPGAGVTERHVTQHAGSKENKNHVSQVTRVTPCSAEIPEEWIAGVDALWLARPPQEIPQDRWALALRDADRLLIDWGCTAVTLGWGTLDIFGVHPAYPLARLDGAGLAWLLQGAGIRSLSAQEAAIVTQRGAYQTYRRGSITGPAIPLWQLIDKTPGKEER